MKRSPFYQKTIALSTKLSNLAFLPISPFWGSTFFPRKPKQLTTNTKTEYPTEAFNFKKLLGFTSFFKRAGAVASRTVGVNFRNFSYIWICVAPAGRKVYRTTVKQSIDAIRELLLFAVLVGIAISMFTGCDKQEPIQESILADCEEYPAGVTTTLIGRTKHDMLYEIGSVLVLYEDHIRESRTSSENIVPIPSVNNFFIQKGYTPKVLGMLDFNEFISVGEGVDVVPMLEDLSRVSGVIAAGVLPLFKVSDLIYDSQIVDSVDPEDGNNRFTSVPPALIEVGKTSAGLLYDLGSIVIRYHGRIAVAPSSAVSADLASSKAVSNFFLDRGYSPKKRLVHVYVEVIQIDACADIMSLLEDLKTIPGVADAQLDVIHTAYDKEPKILKDLKDID